MQRIGIAGSDIAPLDPLWRSSLGVVRGFSALPTAPDDVVYSPLHLWATTWLRKGEDVWLTPEGDVVGKPPVRPEAAPEARVKTWRDRPPLL